MLAASRRIVLGRKINQTVNRLGRLLNQQNQVSVGC